MDASTVTLKIHQHRLVGVVRVGTPGEGTVAVETSLSRVDPEVIAALEPLERLLRDRTVARLTQAMKMKES